MFCEHNRTVEFNNEMPVTRSSQVATRKVCSACGVHLPDTWGCLDCEFIELPVFGEPRGLRYTKGQACVRHTEWRPVPTFWKA